MSYSAFLSNVGDVWTRRVACSDCPAYATCTATYRGNSGIICSDVIITEIVREIMLETAANLTPKTRAAIREELKFPPVAEKITKEERDALRVKRLEILREMFKA